MQFHGHPNYSPPDDSTAASRRIGLMSTDALRAIATDDAIEALRREAEEEGDANLVAICDGALIDKACYRSTCGEIIAARAAAAE